jgi:hypothetical protein
MDDYQIPTDENGSAIVKELYILEKVSKKKEIELKDNISVEEDQLYLEDESRVRIITMV